MTVSLLNSYPLDVVRRQLQVGKMHRDVSKFEGSVCTLSTNSSWHLSLSAFLKGMDS